jgi:hypothetical protein
VALFYFSGLTNGFVALNTFDSLRDVRGFLRWGLAGFSAFHAALSAQFKVFFFFS